MLKMLNYKPGNIVAYINYAGIITLDFVTHPTDHIEPDEYNCVRYDHFEHPYSTTTGISTTDDMRYTNIFIEDDDL